MSGQRKRFIQTIQANGIKEISEGTPPGYSQAKLFFTFTFHFFPECFLVIYLFQPLFELNKLSNIILMDILGAKKPNHMHFWQCFPAP